MTLWSLLALGPALIWLRLGWLKRFDTGAPSDLAPPTRLCGVATWPLCHTTPAWASTTR